ncbi:MAG: DNA-3-methyladenine glycosylase [Clostridia bacterium]|nr:DNA-3-methyladenine glycosylase [Clostridia bacterium]
MKTEIKGNDIIITQAECFSAEISCMCGQAFRWKNENGVLHGIAGNKSIDIEKTENGYIFRNTDENTFNTFWRKYFDLDRDYAKICALLSTDENLKQACEQYYGIRILKQDPWEALCSFIISQNNNIPRISGIISRLCELYGEQINETHYSFPSYERLKGVTVEDLAPLRSGFRAKYIVDAVDRLVNGEIVLDEIYDMPIEQARLTLMKIKGVGAKVAECTLLYGFGRTEAFPVDVWVKRIMAELYPDGLPVCTDGVQGIAQQYLFHWRRNKE